VTVNRLFDEDEIDQPGRGYAGQRQAASGGEQDHEISLGTPTILGIFFALALICAGFFGFGYSLGRKSAQAASPPLDSSSSSNSFGAPKPAAGSLFGQSASPAPQLATVPTATPAAETATVPLVPASASKSAVSPADAMIVGEKPAAGKPLASAAVPAISGQQTVTPFFVQVAAVSSQDVADILLSSLEKKGYSVAVRHEPQDKLLHVQIGPFADKKEAEAMRQRVLADGFNAIVK